MPGSVSVPQSTPMRKSEGCSTTRRRKTDTPASTRSAAGSPVREPLRPVSEVLEGAAAERDDGLRQVALAGTPYLSLAANPVGAEDRAFITERLPQAELVVWPVGHHFPHLTEPRRFAELVLALAEGRRTAPSVAGIP